MKKFLVFSISTIFYYLLLTVIIFSFSYLSLVYGKTYDIFWIKSIQKKIYTRGYRNIWQYNKSCASFDKNLLYKPNIGKCNFLNPEFKIILNISLEDTQKKLDKALKRNLDGQIKQETTAIKSSTPEIQDEEPISESDNDEPVED